MNSFIQNNQEIISVSDVNNLAKGLLEKDLSNVWIQGEISSFTAHGSGHWYFTIKDKKSALDCVMFKFDNINLLFEPKVGDELILNGNVSIYSPTGRYQFNVKHIEVSGEGALLRAFEELKKKLELEGLFDETKKKDLPEFPMEISVITSATGAVIKDIINVLSRRSPNMTLTLVEAQVQGKQAEKSICNAIERANSFRQSDLIILARGGGSIEDLWCFNMESVARSIFNSEIPLISAVGHETDFTISDFVSDLRAPTPTAAAEIASNGYYNLNEKLQTFKNDLYDNISSLITNKKYIVNTKKAELKNPLTNLKEKIQKIDNIDLSLLQAQKNFLKEKALLLNNLSSFLHELNPKKNIKELHLMLLNIKSKIELHTLSKLKFSKSYLIKLESNIKALDPLSILERGYSIVETEDGKIVKNSREIKAGQKLSTRFATGSASVKVIDKS